MTADAEGQPLKLLIAGGGVAALEAALALDELAADLVDVELLAPDTEFVHRPLLVAEPFGVDEAARYDFAGIVGDAGATQHRGLLAGVDPAGKVARTRDGEELAYDALLLAFGARPVEAVPGALTFSGEADAGELSALLASLGDGEVERLAFVAPPGAKWPIVAYELALLTSARVRRDGLAGIEIVLVTHEAEPLELFGGPGAEMTAELLNEAGIRVETDAGGASFGHGRLELADGRVLEVDRAVALPNLEVPDIPGVPQRESGFIPTDTQMLVTGLDSTWAAGDATWFPIKQGGLAAQQADVAARAIAVRAGARLPQTAFQPVLRGKLLTGGIPRYLRSAVGDIGGRARAAAEALWDPREKLAGRHLGPYLARRRGESAAGLSDLDPEGNDPDTSSGAT